jgi:hypothetical protein
MVAASAAVGNIPPAASRRQREIACRELKEDGEEPIQIAGA